MSDDIRGLIDRAFRTYLEPPNQQPAAARLDTGIAAGDLSLVLAGFEIPEDEQLLRAGVLLELGSELVRVTSYDDSTGTCVVVRAQEGTLAASHPAGARVKLAPPFPRISVFEAIADNIVTLYPSLYTVEAAHVASVAGNVAAIEDPLAVEVVEIWSDTFSTIPQEGKIVDFHPSVGGRAVITHAPMGSFWIRYRRRFGSATTENDTFLELGLDPRWATIVMVGACADMFAGADIGPSHTSWVQAAIEAENVPVGTRVNLASAMANYRLRLLNEARSEMRAEYRSTIQQVQVVDSGWF